MLKIQFSAKKSRKNICYTETIFYDFSILRFLFYPILSRTGKKTMNTAQHSRFDRSYRSKHVTRACKQAPLAQLNW